MAKIKTITLAGKTFTVRVLPIGGSLKDPHGFKNRMQKVRNDYQQKANATIGRIGSKKLK